MNITKLSVNNSLLVNLLSVFIICIGFFSMFQMRREAFPQVDYDIVTVTTVYPGAPAEDVEKFVTIPVEEMIKGVSGIEEMESKSEEGLSTIAVTIDPGVLDKDKVVNDIQRAVDRVQGLPSAIEDDPETFELATREFPVIEITLSGETESVRRMYAESLEDLLADAAGVASVRTYGIRNPEFWVEVDPNKLNEYYVSLQEIMNALRARNVTIPGGELKTPTSEYSIRTTGEFRTLEEIEEVIIRANDSGNWLRVKDVAVVKETFEDPRAISRLNGQRAASLVVIKSEQADAIKVVDRVMKIVDDFQLRLPDGMELTTTNDFSYYIKRRLGVLTTNGVIGFILVLLILFLFLDPVPAFVTAMGIPIALCLSFLMMSFFGISINLVSMLGIILVLGMLVDDGIIVSENVYRYVEGGMSPREATLKGTQEVLAPVTVTILTTFAAFAPLMFMTDIMGKFIREIPLVVIITLSASLVEAFLILPSHLSDTLSYFKHKHSRDAKEKKWYRKIRNLYLGHLRYALQWRYLVMTLLVVVFLFSVWLVGSKQLKFLLFAGEGIEYLWLRVEGPKGTPLERMEELLLPVEEIIRELPDGEVDAQRTLIGSIESERGFDPNARRGTHLAQVTIFLTPLQDRERTPQEIVADLRERLESVEGFENIYTEIPREGPPTGPAIQVGIKGEDYEVMQEMAEPVLRYLKGQADPLDFQNIFSGDSDKDTREKSRDIFEQLKSEGLLDSEGIVTNKVDRMNAPSFFSRARSVLFGSDTEPVVTLEEVLPELTPAQRSQTQARLTALRKNMLGVSDINMSYEFGKKQLKVIVDEQKARTFDLTIDQIANTTRNVFKGGVATTIKPEKAEKEIDVLVRFPEDVRNNRKVFDEILVPNREGKLVRLQSVARVEEEEGVFRINHEGGKRILYVTAQVDNKTITSFEVNQDMAKRFKDLENEHLGYAIVYSGEYEDQQKSFRNLLTSYLFALFLIFILLVAMFRSLIQPFVVMSAIPFGIIGVILAFWLHDLIPGVNRPLNFFAMMGLVGLTGIVVNDSVVLVDFINRLRKQGKSRRDSILEGGGMRLRPVIMTSVTTIGGLVSVAYGIGGGDPFLKPLALAIVWGLVFSTGLTLIGIPCLYAIIDDVSSKVLGRPAVSKQTAIGKAD